MWHEIAIALCLVLVIEGLLPFISPQRWRRMVLQVANVDDRSIRLMGFISMVLGTALLYWVN
jgi:uncharacterized protein YjeT (DUF2065 family)